MRVPVRMYNEKFRKLKDLRCGMGCKESGEL